MLTFCLDTVADRMARRAEKMFLLHERFRQLVDPPVLKEKPMTTETPTTTLRALRDHVFLRAVQADQVSAGGILMPSERPERNRGEVVAAGPWAGVKTGDIVIFNMQRASTAMVDDEELLVVREEDLQAVLANPEMQT